jgi:hypothetical protein
MVQTEDVFANETLGRMVRMRYGRRHNFPLKTAP